MLCLPVTGPDLVAAKKQVDDALPYADLLEFRLDLFKNYTIRELRELRATLCIPIIFTLRKKEQGGYYQGCEQERLQHLKVLAKLAPTYIDLEEDLDPFFIKQFVHEFPALKLIVSHHNLTCTPTDLEAILRRMQQLPACFYKLACKALSTNDALRMLHFTRQHAPVLAMCMGEKGKITRILGPIMGVPWTYVYMHQKTAEGQLSLDEFLSTYNLPLLNTKTAIYGLIGGVVTTSLSHFTHNKFMQKLDLQAVYIKMSVEVEELENFFMLASQLGICGLSVTMPLKEHVLSFLDEIDEDAKHIGAVNTIVLKEGALHGYNTDGIGACDALETMTSIANKKTVVLGAGGAARAVIYEAKKRGACVCVLNRNPEKARLLATQLGVQSGALEAIHDISYDLLINTTPHPAPISITAMSPHIIVMDIKTFPKITAFLQQALEQNCKIVFGYQMFIYQAIEQYKIWFTANKNLEKMQDILQAELFQHL